MGREELEGIVREIKHERMVQGMLALGDAVRSDCDECESLDLPGGEPLSKFGLRFVVSMIDRREGVGIS